MLRISKFFNEIRLAIVASGMLSEFLLMSSALKYIKNIYNKENKISSNVT